jgi:hypothetical protein
MATGDSPRSCVQRYSALQLAECVREYMKIRTYCDVSSQSSFRLISHLTPLGSVLLVRTFLCLQNLLPPIFFILAFLWSWESPFSILTVAVTWKQETEIR